MWVFWVAFFLLSLSSQAQAYYREFVPSGDSQEILSLIYLELRSQASNEWSLVPEDISFEKFLLLPQKDFLLNIYAFELTYPTKSILYQTFLEYNLRYFLADKTIEYLDYRKDLEKFKQFYLTAKKILGPYFQNFTEEKANPKKETLTPEGGELAGDNLEEFLAKRLIERLSSPGYSSPTYSGGSTSVSGRRWDKLWQRARYESQKKTETNPEVYGGDEMPGFFRRLLGWIFGLIDWLGKNKEVLLIFYGFILLIVFLFSAAKK